jgi:hypothetical protein
METSKNEFRRMFPKLSEEMENGKEKVAIRSLRSDWKAADRVATSEKNLVNYDPGVIDFLRRCDNKQQAEEIITFMEKRGEIPSSYAQKLRTQLRKRGLRSFGTKKEEGYYFKGGRE